MEMNERPKKACSKPSQGGGRRYTNPTKVFVDQFVNLAHYLEPRSYEDVSQDMYELWKANPKLCVYFTAYVRLITRKCRVVTPNGVIYLDTQRGGGLKNEGLLRMMWLATYHKSTFHANMPYFAAAGCWKDFINMLVMDAQLHGYKHRLDWDFFRKTIYAGLVEGQTCDLVKKYLPRVRANTICKTDEAKARNIVAKYLAEGLYGKPKEEGDYSSYRKYRKMKNSGTVMKWQQLISHKKLLDIDFDTVPGKALALLVGSKFLKQQGLAEKYQKWLKTRRKPCNDGFVHNLFKPFGLDKIAEFVPEFMGSSIDVSFNTFVKNAKLKKVSPLLVIRDISNSAYSEIEATETSAYSVGKAYAMYHSELMPVAFSGMYGVFANNRCDLRKWEGTTPTSKWISDTEEALVTSPTLSMIADMLISIKSGGIREGEFPNGCLVISGALGHLRNTSEQFIEFKSKLLKAGFSKEFVKQFKLIIWHLASKQTKPKVELIRNVSNCFFVNGLSQSTAGFITGEKRFQNPSTPKELFDYMMNQELLNMMVLEKDTPRKNASVQSKPAKAEKPIYNKRTVSTQQG